MTTTDDPVVAPTGSTTTHGTANAPTAAITTHNTATFTPDAFAERVFAAALGWAESMSIYLGDRLGWYRSLAADGPATADELATRTATSSRYAREWLEQQAVVGILDVDDCGGEPDERRFALPPGPAEVLTDKHSLLYLAPLTRMFAASGAQMPAVIEAFRTGGGVSWQQLGADAREAQADLNRPWFDQLPTTFAGLPELHEVLSQPGARIADVGTGAGWSAIALAKAYPQLEVDGYDNDDPSVELARRNAAAAGVVDRVRFHAADGDGVAGDGPFDAAFAFECIHDMPRPVEVLSAMRTAVVDGGPVVIMDEAVDANFTAPGNEIEKFMYGCSLFVCLPDGLSHRPSVGTGTVMRPSTLRSYARSAGFTDVTTLAAQDFGFWRFYLLSS